jgi:hypothetical protein
MKTFEEILKTASHGDALGAKLASMKQFEQAGEPVALLKVAAEFKAADYDAMSPVAIEQISNMVNKATTMVKKAEEDPGLPTGLSPQTVETPTYTSPTRKEENISTFGDTDPSIDLEGSAPVEQAPGTSPTETDIPKEISAAEKTAFVNRSIAIGIKRGKDVLIKRAMEKRAERVSRERNVKSAEIMIEALTRDYGKEKVAEFLNAYAKKGFDAAQKVIYGGRNV